MTNTDKQLYEFGEFRLNAAERTLWCDDEPVAITPKALEMLCLLLERPGKVIAKEELIERLWPDTLVEESNLTQTIFLLRKSLSGHHGHEANEHEAAKWIENAPRRGYKFVGECRLVTPVTDEPAPLAPEPVPPTPPPSLKKIWPRLAVAFALLSTLGGGLFLYWQTRRPSSPLDGIKAIAVLPFKSLEAAGQDDYVGLGMCDDLITRLSNIRQITVRPTSAMRRYLGPEKDAVTAGRELGVDAVLEGNIRQSNQRIRVTVQLINVRDGRPLWAGSFDEQFTHIFAVQDSISDQVIRALTLQLSGTEQARVAQRFTENAEAYRLYLQGRYFWNKRTAEGFGKAVELFEQAIALDPNYARAYAGVADAYSLLASYNLMSPHEAFPKAQAAAEKAIALDGSLAEAHTSLASILNSYAWDWRGAEAAYRRALELNPSYATAHQWYGEYLIQTGRFDQAEQQMNQARALDPLSLIINTNLGWTLFMARDNDRAITQLRKVLELDERFANARIKLGLAYAQKGLLPEAQKEFEQAQLLAGETSTILSARAATLAAAGSRAEAQRILTQLETRARSAYVEPSDIALIYVALGQRDQAFAWLDKAYAQRSEALLCWLKVDPRVDPLREDVRLKTLLKKIGMQ